MNNRNTICDTDLVRSEQFLDQGIPLPFLTGKYEVAEGFQAVILVGGSFEETLTPGFYYLSRYQMFRNVRSKLVDMRIKNLHIKTSREFQIDKPVPVQIDLELTVDYKVVDPRMVATEIESPLSTLYDKVIEAARPVISNANIDEVRKNGEGIGQVIFQRLKANKLENTIGIEVRNVVITTIKALDTDGDALGQQFLDGYTKIQDWRMETAMLNGTTITPAWLMVNRPEIYQQMMAGNTQVMRDLIDKGLLDPASFLNQSIGNPGGDITSALLNSLNPNFSQNKPYDSGQSQQLLGATNSNLTPDIHARMKEEVELLKKVTGTVVNITPGEDENKIPDGTYHMMVETPTSSGGKLVCYFNCDKHYPNSMPLIDIEVNGEEVPFESSILRHWSKQYLVELVREALAFAG